MLLGAVQTVLRVTLVTTVALLFAAFGSSVVDVADAVFEMLVAVVFAESVPATLAVTVAPLASAPSAHERWLAAIVQLPAVVVAVAPVMSAGSVSVNATAAAGSGPAFLTVIV
jgi:hypothetical protein